MDQEKEVHESPEIEQIRAMLNQLLLSQEIMMRRIDRLVRTIDGMQRLVKKKGKGFQS